MSKKSNVKKLLWYSVENLTTIAFALLSVALVARIFGPESLGKLSYIQAISALTIFITTLGLDHIVVRDLARKPDDMNYISTVFLTQFFMWLVQCIVMYLALYIMGDGNLERDIIVIFAWIALTAYFSRATVIKLYFQSINKPKEIGSAALSSRLIALVYLLLALYFDFTYEYVVAFIPLQAALQFFILAYRFSLHNKVAYYFDVSLIKKVVKESAPLLIAASLYPVFMQADIVIIANYLTDADVGIYSAASKVIMQFSFVGTIITMTFYVSMAKRIDSKSDDRDYYLSGIVKILTVTGVITVIVMWFSSSLIVDILFGDEFKDAAGLLNVLIVKTVFIYIAAVVSRVIILMGLAKYELIKSFLAAAFSFTANLLLVPIYGLEAAAVISVCAYFIADFLIYLFFRDTRTLFFIISKAVVGLFLQPRLSFKNINYVISSRC